MLAAAIVFGPLGPPQRRTFTDGSVRAAVVFPEHLGVDGCGVSHVFSHVRTYLVIQTVLAEKGCAPLASFIDLASGEVAEDAVLDHDWDYRFGLRPPRFIAETLRVMHAEHVDLEAQSLEVAQASPRLVPWPFVIVHTMTATGRPHTIAYCIACSDPVPAAGSDKLPTVGSNLRIGEYVAPNYRVMLMFEAERVVLLSPADEARYAALQTPTPKTQH